jgi:hypothetical protein
MRYRMRFSYEKLQEKRKMHALTLKQHAKYCTACTMDELFVRPWQPLKRISIKYIYLRTASWTFSYIELVNAFLFNFLSCIVHIVLPVVYTSMLVSVFIAELLYKNNCKRCRFPFIFKGTSHAKVGKIRPWDLVQALTRSRCCFFKKFSDRPFNSCDALQTRFCLIKPLLSWKDFAPRRMPICYHVRSAMYCI